uniref:Uncharacterized protein n=1 Tax=Romanomermis culicivorax TaxID=13658 RepID=A0A915JIR4_ROMCU
ALENGNSSEAGKIKSELESQRKTSKKSSSSTASDSTKYQVEWFKEVNLPSTNTKSYKFNHRYWSSQSANFESENFVHLW